MNDENGTLMNVILRMSVFAGWRPESVAESFSFKFCFSNVGAAKMYHDLQLLAGIM